MRLAPGSKRLVRGVRLSFTICAFGECPAPENAGLGLLLLVTGLVAGIGGCTMAAGISAGDARFMQVIVGAYTALLVGAAALRYDVPTTANLAHTGMLVAVVAFVAPPRSPLWLLGVAGSLLMAAQFADLSLPGVVLSAVILSAGAALRVTMR